MFRKIFAAILIAGVASCSPKATAPVKPTQVGLSLVDSGGRAIKSLESGSSLQAGAHGLAPNAPYEFALKLDDKLVSYARLSSDGHGTIAPFVLWFQSGVVGCALTERELAAQHRVLAFHSFEEAEKTLTGRRLSIVLHEAEPLSGKGRSGAERDVPLLNGKVLAQTELPVVPPTSSMVYPATSAGCLKNSALTGSQDMYVSGRHFQPGQTVDISVVPNQRQWHVGDEINDVTGIAGAAASERVHADANGNFTAMVWAHGLQQRGAYDIVAHAPGVQSGGHPTVAFGDTVSFASDTAYILFLYYPPGGPQMDLAGRPLSWFPYFEYSDSFAKTEDVWGAVDPTYIPAGHPGGTYAAYYVVNHKTSSGWTSNNALADVSGGIEIMPVKAGCINMTDTIIWHAPLAVGDYDVVVNFGSTPASSAVAFVDDFTYDASLDFLDGAVQIGFRVADDPYDLGPMQVGQASYSFDDLLFLSNQVSTWEGGAPGSANVDLRAVVRYPATAAGTNTPVAPGAHPIFVIEHGNHAFCNINGPNHVTCPVGQRKLNHFGYMHLLEALASRGVIAVSIDAYDLTGSVPQWTTERSELILKHLEFWSHLNDASTYPTYSDPFAGLFQNHVDMTKISVSGHSRGGEASVGSYLRNQLRPVAQQFSIGSVSSIAPVDLSGFNLGDVPYFVILPAADCDVSDLGGQRIYDRAGGAGDITVKSAIEVYGADHNFFNTVWAADQDDCGSSARADFIPAADQQKIGEAYLAAFVRSQLLGEDVYEDLLRGRMRFPSFAGRKIYAIRHDKNHLNVDSGTAAGTASGATVATIVNPSPHQTAADHISWTNPAHSYTFSIPPTDVSGYEVLSLRVAQTTSASNPATGQEFEVWLTGGGHSQHTYTNMFAPIPPVYNSPAVGTAHTVMTTVRIPLHSFITNNSQVDLTAIDTIKFAFTNPTQGDVYVDDVEFSR